MTISCCFNKKICGHLYCDFYYNYGNITAYSATVDEDLALSTTVLTVNATDTDSIDTSDGQVAYAFVSAPTEFMLSDSGDIILVTALDRESADLITFEVEATDGGSGTVTATVSITVTDLNDNLPIFQSPSYAYV